MIKQNTEEDVSVGSGAVATSSFPIGMKRKNVDGKQHTPHQNLHTRSDWKLFEVKNETFIKFKPGVVVFEKWSSYLDLQDSSEKGVYDYAKNNKNITIVLKNSTTGSLKRILRGKNE
jgi:hypothetical protein